MKKSTPSKKKVTRGNSRKTSKANSRGRKIMPPGPEADVLNLSSGAQELQARSSRLQRKSDELHKSIERLHRKVSFGKRKGNEKKPALIPDGQIVQDEADAAEKSAPGKPFPIVGIGASAGGFEAF